MDHRVIGNHLRALRKSQRLTQAQLAEGAHVSLRSVVYWESGQVIPREQELSALLTALSVSAEGQAELTARWFPQQNERLRRSHLAVSPTIADLPSCGPGDLLAALRARQGMTREQLAAGLQVSASTLSRWENNHYTISESALAQFPHLLDASPAEIQTLRNSLVAPREELEFDPARPYDHEQMMAEAARFRDARFLPGNETVDLTAFALRQRLWRLGVRHPQARLALASVSLEYSSWLYARERSGQAARLAQQALRLYEQSPPAHALDIPTAINVLSACVFVESEHSDEAGLRFLRPWLSRVDSVPAQALLFSDAALYAARAGKVELAERYFGHAFSALAKDRRGNDSTGESEGLHEELYWYYNLSRARSLLEWGKPWEAFHLLQGTVPTSENLMANASLATLLLYAQLACAAGERSWAEQWLRGVYQQLETADFPRIRKRADAIARQL